MANISEELARQTLTFPCEFVIKVFGLASKEFETEIIAIMQRHIPAFKNEQVQNRSSKDGKYDALSISITADSRQQLDAIYHDLTNHPLVLMAL